MNYQTQHLDDHELQQLVFGEDDCAAYRQAASHVETCERCQLRLSDLSSSADFDRDVRTLLSEDSGSGRDPWPYREPSASEYLSPPSHPEMLGRLGRYEVERVIGSGGMGVVFKGFDTELNRPVAIKVLARHLAHSGAARQRFAREAKAAAAIVHENVVAIHNVESNSDTPYLVMQFVAGESLQTRVDEAGPLGSKEILRIGIQAAAGLAAAHRQGVVHRDVKPANMLLENGVERVLLTDFGLARTVDDASLTQTGIIAGTPHYMSPEQANGQPADQRTDLFSLGAVLYFMATGHPPFRAERAMGVLNRICHDRQRPLWQVAEQVPDELSVLVDRLLEKQPSRRPTSAEAVQTQLEAFLARLQQPRNGLYFRLHRLALRYPKKLMVGITMIAAAMLLGVIAMNRTSEIPEPDTALQEHTEASAPRKKSSEVPLVLNDTESVEFGNAMNEIRHRLEDLNSPGVFATMPDSTQDISFSLQSVHQRLDRLQMTNSESQQPLTGDEN
ncbi:MAG: serine/threonine protein kinase [Planctomycetales bacterium]|nr:serine/threonine protein kinase [Planctomycetales bacterium]